MGVCCADNQAGILAGFLLCIVALRRLPEGRRRAVGWSVYSLKPFENNNPEEGTAYSDRSTMVPVERVSKGHQLVPGRTWQGLLIRAG